MGKSCYCSSLHFVEICISNAKVMGSNPKTVRRRCFPHGQKPYSGSTHAFKTKLLFRSFCFTWKGNPSHLSTNSCLKVKK